MSDKLLGDMVEDAAKKMGIDKIRDEIEKLTKQKCNCGRRKERLNQLHIQLKEMMGR